VHFLHHNWKLVAFGLLLFSFQSFGQNAGYRFERLTIDQGLSQNTVTDLAQDQQGFIWIATLDGLNRFDGLACKVYRNEVNNPFSLRSNAVNTVFVDSQGTLWVGTRRGLHYLDRQTDRFHLVEDSVLLPPNLSRVTDIAEDNQQQLWVGFDGNGLLRIDLKSPQRPLKLYQKDPANPTSLPDAQIYALHTDQRGKLWLGTESSFLVSFDPQTEQFAKHHYLDTAQSRTDDALTSVSSDAQGRIWFSSFMNGVFALDPQTSKVVNFTHNGGANSISENSISEVLVDREGIVWIGTSIKGLDRLDPRTGQITHFTHDPSAANSLSLNEIYALFEDQQGFLWVGTYNGGVNKMDRNRSKFSHYYHLKENPNSLSGNGMRGIRQDQRGLLWVGTTGAGLNLIDRAKGQFTHFLPPPEVAANATSITTVARQKLPYLAEERINVLTEDRDGNVWVGLLNRGLQKFTPRPDPATGQLTWDTELYQHVEGNYQSLAHNSIRSLYYEAASHSLWMGTLMGLSRLDLRTNAFTHYGSLISHPDSLSHSIVRHIVADPLKPHWLWVATEGGLNVLDRQTGKFRRYVNNAKDPTSLSSNLVTCLLVEPLGRVWAGTAGGGLNLLDRETGKFTYFTETDGLPNNYIYGILQDRQGKLWLSTNRGLACFDPSARQSTNYLAADGLQSNEFNVYSFHQNAKGEIFFGGINGFNSFWPDSLKASDFQPKVVLTDFKLFNRPVAVGDGSPLRQQISQAAEVVLQYQDYVFSFDFAALDHSKPSKIRYQYQMEGFDDAWIDTDATRRTATYTNLPPGDYTFRVRGTNADGVWSPHEARITVTVKPPFWQTWWFRLLMLAAGLLAIYGIFRWRVRQVEAQKTKLEAQVALRTAEVVKQKDELQAKQGEINQQKQALEQSYAQLSDKNRHIMDSIRYAQTIQSTILPPEEEFCQHFAEHFVIFKPKDIVSGDFYWLAHLPASEAAPATTWLATIDCTGHGVPGAFMSMMGHGFLSEIVEREGVGDPAQVLTLLNERVRAALKQSNGSGLNNDGMDACLCALERQPNGQAKLTYSGARRPLLIRLATNGRLIEFKADRKSVGGGASPADQETFSTQTWLLQPGDSLYLGTDGFSDQNNDHRRKLGRSRLHEVLTQNGHLPMRMQGQVLSELLETHRGKQPLRDDITLVGVRV
jgi:ligand-binding sensor domain-containing protein/serine phosphatase RsbU (regulator of sigma subunit)